MTGSQRWKTLGCFVLIHLAAFSGSAAEWHRHTDATRRGGICCEPTVRAVTIVGVKRPMSAGRSARAISDRNASTGYTLAERAD